MKEYPYVVVLVDGSSVADKNYGETHLNLAETLSKKYPSAKAFHIYDNTWFNYALRTKLVEL